MLSHPFRSPRTLSIQLSPQDSLNRTSEDRTSEDRTSEDRTRLTLTCFRWLYFLKSPSAPFDPRAILRPSLAREQNPRDRCEIEDVATLQREPQRRPSPHVEAD